MENTPITQEIFSAFMKCLNQYDLGTAFSFETEEAENTELKPNQEISDSYYHDMEQLESLRLI